MLKTNAAPLAALAAIAIFAGCNGQNGAFRQPSSSLSPAAPVPPGLGVQGTPPAGPAPVVSAVPYELKAESAGPYINFSIYNLGATDLVVEKQHFAIISPNAREVVPYDNQSTVIDLPQPAVVRPNGMIQGRAIFHNVASPVGKRLVYKPDEIGTFADIKRITGLQPAAQ